MADGVRVRRAGRKVRRLVTLMSDMVNEQTGANSAVRLVGIDRRHPYRAEVAGPDSIILGRAVATALRNAGRFPSANEIDPAVDALRSALGAVTDLSVKEPAPPGRNPGERSQWNRPVDKHYLEVREPHRNIHESLSQAQADSLLSAVSGRLAALHLVSPEVHAGVHKRFGHSKEPLAASGDGFVRTILPNVEDAGYLDTLNKLNNLPPDQHARGAARLLLHDKTPATVRLELAAWEPEVNRLAAQIDEDFRSLERTAATYSGGVRIGERAEATAKEMAKRWSPQEHAGTERAPAPVAPTAPDLPPAADALTVPPIGTGQPARHVRHPGGRRRGRSR